MLTIKADISVYHDLNISLCILLVFADSVKYKIILSEQGTQCVSNVIIIMVGNVPLLNGEIGLRRKKHDQDMLNITVWLDGENIKAIGTIDAETQLCIAHASSRMTLEVRPS